MNYLKNSLRLKITVFLLITALIFWLIPSGLIFGEGEDGGDGGTIVEGGEVIPPADTTAPVIILNGDNPATIELGAEYSDAGATASDDVDGDISTSIAVNNMVDASILGEYVVTYNVSDAAGNAAAEVVRTVNVIDSVVPPEEETPPVEELPVTTPSLSTDKADYAPEETVTITGTGFLSNAVYAIVVTRPDSSIVIGDGSFTPGSDTVLTDGSGNFVYSYILDGILGTYLVDAKDETGVTVASTTFTDASYGSIRINKTVTGGLTGTFNFTISRSGETTQYASITINSGSTTGSTIVSNLATGLIIGRTWTVTETSGPGFECTNPSDYSNNVTVYRNSRADTYFTNSPPTYSVRVNKSGLWWGFIGWSYESDEAVFTLTGPAGPDSQVRTVTLDNAPLSGDDDDVTWDLLPAGSYTLDEIYPAGNFRDYTANYTFPYTFTLGPDQTFNVVNTECTVPTTADITINKTVVGPPKAGNFEFIVDDGTSPYSVYIDGAGGTSAPITLETGHTYTITEVDPGVDWDTTWSTTIPGATDVTNGITFSVTGSNVESINDKSVSFENTRKSGTVTVTKRIIDSLTGIDYGPTFGTFNFEIGTGPGGMPFSLTAPDYSETLDVWCGIEYTISETSTDPELVIVTTPITFTATEGDNGTKTFFNRTGSITVVKVDGTDGTLLEGAVLGLFEADGTTPATDAFGNPVGNQITDADGEAYFTKLALGDYVVKEITAPTGYSVAAPVAVSLDIEVSDFGFAMKDPRIPGRVTVIKTDPAGILLDGVGFTIYYKGSGSPVMPERFTSSGMVTFDSLEWGPYVIVETTPPDGYDTSDPVDVVIDATNAESGVTISRINTPTAAGGGIAVFGIAAPGGGIEVLGIQELPFTGLNPLIPISGISTIFAGGLMVALSAIRKRFGKK